MLRTIALIGVGQAVDLKSITFIWNCSW